MIAHVATSQKRGRNGFPGLHSLKCDNLNLLLEERNDESSLKMGGPLRPLESKTLLAQDKNHM